MPNVTGELKDIVGSTLVSRVGRLRFRLVEPSIVGSGVSAGRILPTADVLVAPDSVGAWNVNLASTATLLNDAYYTLSIEWIEPGMPLTDFPDWEIRVGSRGGPLSDFIEFGGGRPSGGPNLSMVLLSLTEPPGLRRGQLWWQTNPDDPTDPRNTGRIYIGA
ncbi:hypothetical protein [Pseudarthrobacter sp. PS3-L1]|uniref:hypothetical protein n=1 Tax=Pseudarthrobacter sp. PS3-L1 TaxID=3046207 RepID=UPI0024B9477B|nr:hypothetical protein [Pseudarthrobacter sp. PS3-L1]MDJ0321650.1 hypothetical protein [Pseudarthrobacter sp. PS3-L1]